MAGRWRVLPRAVTLACLALLPATACRRAPAEPRPFIFIQMADPQFGFFTANADFARETANFEKAIAAANRLHPAFVVVCGDLVHRVGDTVQIAEYRRIAAKLDRSIPLYNVAGNHDVGQVPTPGTLAAYRGKFGADWYAFERNGVVGIVLNSSLVKDPSDAPADAAAQERWLRRTLDSLRRAGRNRVLVFQHHSWFLATPDEADQYYNLPLERRRGFLELFREHGIKHVFAGHYHRNAYGRSGALEMVTSGPVGRPLGPDPSGFRIVTVRGSEVEHRYYPLDSLPSSVPLPTAAAERALRVMSFNIAAGHGDLEQIAETIRAADAHLVALQEVDVHWGERSKFADQARVLAERLGMEARFAPIYRIPSVDPAKPPREYGVALLSRFPITAWRNDTLTRLSTQQEQPVPSRMPGFLEATVQVGGSAVRVFNTHIDYRPDPRVRDRQVAEMLAFIGEPSAPTLLFGDLNAPPTAPELQPLLRRLRDAWPADAGDGFTYPAPEPVRRIDYVLTSSHYRVVFAKVPSSVASDHRPVIVELVRERSRP